jgi:hypothetical protein
MFANFKNIIRVTEINIAITAPTPALIPNTLTTKINISSIVAGITNSDTETFTGSANFSIPDIALIEKSISKIMETDLACLLRLGKRDRIPRPIITPCNNPIDATTKNVMIKFCSARSSIFKVIPTNRKLKMYLGIEV